MRLAATASALAIVVGAATFGAILSQQTSMAVPASSPALAAAVETPATSTVGAATDGSSVAPSAVPLASQAPTPAAAHAAPFIVAQASPARGATPAPAAAPAPPPPQAASSGTSCPGNPNALGVSRVVEIDTTGGPGFGFEHFKSYDFLREGEVVLTFDDGPWPKNTPAVLAALAAHCTKAIFFPIGIHSTWEPGILKQVAAAGHSVGSHTWCHQDLSKTKGHCRVDGKSVAVEYDGKDEIERGISAVRWAVGGPTAPFFRFPALRQPPELIAASATSPSSPPISTPSTSRCASRSRCGNR
jgi:hypothetical protein